MIDLEKYEKQLADVNTELAKLDDQRTKLVRYGIRIEGIVQYLRGKAEEEAAEAKKVPVAEPAEVDIEAENPEEAEKPELE